MARLTQRGQEISSMDDLVALLNKQYTAGTVEVMSSLPHPTIQKFSAINIAIVGASRRFLAQITRHQNEIKFMSGSLQYSDYSDAMQFCVPYEITRADAENHGDGWCRKQYLNS
ncbi:MAG: FAD-dependent thymidylate synthase, partial [Acinetobacter sp.]